MFPLKTLKDANQNQFNYKIYLAKKGENKVSFMVNLSNQ